MSSKNFIIFIILHSISFNAIAQKDTTNSLDEVVITATRTERKLGNIGVPVSIISQKNIRQAASLRLNDILNEQTGIFINDAGFGSAVQMQGLSSDYALIMLNGEPLIGRNSGVLDLKRVAVGNVQKIEIVRGPSSSLYGSEAIAGVINLITKEEVKNKLSASIRYGNFETFDASVGQSFCTKKLKVQVFSNLFHTQLYSIRPYTVDKNLEPLWKFNHQAYLSYKIDDKTKATLLARYSEERFNIKYSVTNLGSVVYSDGLEKHTEYGINPTVTHRFNNKIKSTFRIYHTNYQSTQDLITSTTKDYYDYFRQRLYKAESQTDIDFNKHINLVAGLGYIYENVKSSRYDNENNLKESRISYVFLQSEISIINKVTAIAGVRFDNNSNYQSAVSPKFSLSIKPSSKIHIAASIGYGFKAPDFRQLYLNFTNTAAGGYSVLGALEAKKQIATLQRQGLIDAVTTDYSKLAALKPEISLGINVGVNYLPNNKTTLSINLFRNNLDNLIDYAIVAYYKNKAQIYSYININKAFTQGLEFNAAHKITKNITANAGYQLLFSGNQDEIDKIKQGLVYTRDKNGVARKMELSEYVGLANRSRHITNFKLQYEQDKFYVNLRAIYHSRWAVNDKDGNGVYNTNDEFASEYVQLNATAGYYFKQHYSIQIGCNNITNYKDFTNLPSLMEQNYFISFHYN